MNRYSPFTLYQVSAPHFTAGIEVDSESGTVVQAAPILKWMIGKKIDLKLLEYFQKKEWDIKEVKDGDQG